jgi:hypothetical protein
MTRTLKCRRIGNNRRLGTVEDFSRKIGHSSGIGQGYDFSRGLVGFDPYRECDLRLGNNPG